MGVHHQRAQRRGGDGPKFGVVAVASGTFERRPKPSAYWFAEVARANAVPIVPA